MRRILTTVSVLLALCGFAYAGAEFSTYSSTVEGAAYTGNKSIAGTLGVTGPLTLSHTNGSNTSVNIMHINGSVGLENGSDTWNAILISPTNANHTSGTNQVNGVNVANITGDAEAQEIAYLIGTGWDYDVATAAGTRSKAFLKSALTNNSAIDLFTITLAAGEIVTGRVEYGVNSTGGSSDLQAHSGTVTFACINKGGTVTKDIDESYLAANETSILSAGTQADVWAMKSGNVCTLTLNINSNLSSAVNSVSGQVTIYSDKPITLN